MNEKRLLNFLVPITFSIIFLLLPLFGVYQSLEDRIYNILIRAKSPVTENEDILFVNIDDTSIANVGTFPWSRDIMADGLILMREFEARYAVFDIEYIDPSPRGVDTDYLQSELPQDFEQEFSYLNEYVTGLFTAFREGRIASEDLDEYIEGFSSFSEMSKNSLLASVGQIAEDNDTYLGQAARFFENSFFTVHLSEEEEETTVSEEYLQLVLRKIPLKNVTAIYIDPASQFPEILPAIRLVLEQAGGAGYVNVIVDDDGVQRRMDLVREYQGHYFAQLGFAPLLDWMGNPEVVLNKRNILLRGAQHPATGEAKDIVIPLTEDGMMLINWPKGEFIDSFRHISYYELVFHKEMEDSLLYNLRIMNDAGYLSFYQGETSPLELYIYADTLKTDVLEGGDTGQIEDYREIRQIFFQEVKNLLEGTTEQEILASVDQSLVSPDATEADIAWLSELKIEIQKVFEDTRNIYTNLELSRQRLGESLPGSLCFLGWIGTSTTDIGVNPFQKEYMNVGTHGAVVNTILSEQFLDDVPWWIPTLFAVVLAFLVTFVIQELNPLPSILIGVGLLILIIAGGTVFFLLTGIYVEFLTPFITVFLSFLVITVLKFFRSEKEKSYIRNAFSHYLSTDVINDLLDDPEKLLLGGESKPLTAMFTDIRGFSSISEKLTATDLVKLLNLYLTDMSNTILDLRGTIDKYEGDAIISFFGAPVEFEDHARRACLAAIRMKKIEIRLNEHFLNNGLTPAPLFTRIGINTGEMVVGNMGTEQKMDYTIMGSAVNLASRLEGVNKQYGTWILISESTYQEGASDFMVRPLDRVRVVGIETALRLYELIDEKSNVDDKTQTGLDIFQEGIGYFEAKDWAGAEEAFRNVMKTLPDDGPSQVFIKRCQQYTKKPPPASWDGVFNLGSK